MEISFNGELNCGWDIFPHKKWGEATYLIKYLRIMNQDWDKIGKFNFVSHKILFYDC